MPISPVTAVLFVITYGINLRVLPQLAEEILKHVENCDTGTGFRGNYLFHRGAFVQAVTPGPAHYCTKVLYSISTGKIHYPLGSQ
jgi:hypothetical protein